MAAVGRPKNEQQTRMIRVSEDLADRLGWLARLGGETVSEIVDPLIRPEVERRFALVEPQVKKIKALERQAATHDLGGEGG